MIHMACHPKPWRPTMLLWSFVGQVDGLPIEASAANYAFTKASLAG